MATFGSNIIGEVLKALDLIDDAANPFDLVVRFTCASFRQC